ncbi:amidohydrolase (plasmid) [Priestia megaterium]|uniref:Amidohydrolase family protein n=1 Tax=Priestia megaterium (strain ATCC 14581 / DSM 32 / CCUG 1817 / JCM 2506 / NBRC 15308 / NCIMB 9376 / NCTC 10342 / NRRL B-14308 / VKM B-512 / Ford 19) TaxID=1348623 RepID=A0A0B6A5A4_PRIM2|nr:M20 family metallopeptidase [Priestia megaterium]AJI20125.1 amidohydrolase family protein [Priestia megaterium NBRC 15308 = ATCC 14581]KFM94731.1 amidohydrolase family protein [Priestia megaterium]KGJ80469.1 peptidase M20 [Priestia megaterium NBRC 15308 = ATCC 14581]KNH17329.1 peptidase M20 [Priestia megaterium]MDR4231583.1 amidohydrolase [Priestia megaterium]
MTNAHSMVEQVNRLYTQLIEWRRRFHQHPELSFQEFGTSKFVAETLRSMDGIDVETGIGVETSVVGTLTSGAGPTIAIRADMDALPIQEENTTDYCSLKRGVMHACGHDAHTAILLGIARVLASAFKKGKLKGTVKFVFQPAEESTDENGLSGSPYMVQAGVYDDVDAAIALHMCPWLPVGEIQINNGYSMANVDVFEGKIYGTGGHGAYPELGTDPIWMLGPVMQALHGIISRKVSALDAGVVSIGQVHAGTASNIIPTEVSITGTLRSYTPEVRDLLALELEKAFSIVGSLDGKYSFKVERGEPALNNSAAINDWIIEAIEEMYPQLGITRRPFGMGGEDFGYVTQKLPGSMIFLGCALKDEVQRDLHTPIFDIDETCLPIGVAVLAQTAIKFLKGEVTLPINEQLEVQTYGT